MKDLTIKRYRIIIILVAIFTACVIAGQFVHVYLYNKTVNTTIGCDKTQQSYMDLHFRGDATSSWYKQDMDINGIIYDGSLINTSKHPLTDWTLRINILQECYINQFWNGTVEIHQNAGTKDEKVQTLNLADYDVDALEVDYVMSDADLLVPLHKGDYIIYYPNAEFKEDTVQSGEEIVIGVIFYYADELDLTDYSIDYHYHMEANSGPLFYIAFGLVILEIIFIVNFFTFIHITRKARREMEIRQSGIACMSDLYKALYMVNIEDDTLIPISEDNKEDEERPKDASASEQINHMFRTYADEDYLDILLEFGDLDTLPQRLEDENYITIEYFSPHFGHCRVRFIAMDRNKGESVKKVLLTIEDINKEKAEIDKMVGQVEKARSDSRAKSTFLANMSHEIRTPINTILGLDTMILREADDPTIKTYARDIKTSGRMLLSLINSILDFSKLEAGKMQLSISKYSLKEVLLDVRSITKPKLDAKNLEFKIEINETLPDKLFGDEMMIKQILINILTNAAKYTDEGSVKLSVFGKVTSKDLVHLLVSVKDTGIGIRPEDLKKLSQRYSRFDSKKNKNVEGTGIGMSLVSGMLSLMGSTLKVTSVYGSGSEFYFELDQKIADDEPIGKLDLEALPVEEETEYHVTFTAANARILVVDDNEMNLIVFTNLLKRTRINIDTAISAQAALKLCDKTKYDIIFMDHMMPEMDGIEAFERIKKMPDGLNNNTPVIILTANAMQGAREEYLEAGFKDFLAKPLNPSELENKIKENLSPDKVEVQNTQKEDKGEDMMLLPNISDLDTTYALEHCGGAQALLQLLRQFVSVAPLDIKELYTYYEALLENPDDEAAIDSYRIKVHAMKISASLCGALQVYGMAAQLENAARQGNVKKIVDVTPYFNECWEELHGSIKDYFQKDETINEDKEMIDEATLKSLLGQLSAAMDAYDISSADDIISKLGGYTLPGELSSNYDKLCSAVANLDAPTCKQICEETIG